MQTNRKTQRPASDSESEGEDLFDENWERGVDYKDNDSEVSSAGDESDDGFINDRSESSAASRNLTPERLIGGLLTGESHLHPESGVTSETSSDTDLPQEVEESDNQADLTFTEISDVSAAFGFDWTKYQGELRDWLQQDAPRRVTKNRIYNFFLNFRGPNDHRIYIDRINAMTRENQQSFEVHYAHLARVYESTLALWLADAPDALLELFDEVAEHLVYVDMFPNYSSVHKHIRVRIAGLPVCDPIRDFRQIHMNVLVRVEGVVTRRSPVYPQLQAIRYDCGRCAFIIGPIMQRGEKEIKVSQCPSCHSKGPFRVNVALTEYRNHQIIVLQEPPGKVPPGRLPRSLEVILTHDIIDKAKPGEEVDIIGVYRNTFDASLNSRHGFPVFTTVLHANNIVQKTSESIRMRISDTEKDRILHLSRHRNLKRKLLASIAPSIHGREEIKLALLLSLLGGVAKDVGGEQSHRIRGDINVLLLGDPGTAKSQFLKFVEKTADRAVFTTGRGSTAVGLTASVHKDPITGDFTLEGGALVIADKGVCLIDEFDKMSDQDRTSIHEAMEQQTISVARGGIVTTLSARSAVIAAANPIGGRYDPSLSFDSNVDLTTPILSRFDLLFVVRDEVNPDADEILASFVCRSHRRSHPKARQHPAESDVDANGQDSKEDDDPASDKPLPQPLLRSYIQFAKASCRPSAANIDESTIVQLYSELRQQSKQGGIPITVRHMESIIRLSEAHAKLFLREYVTDEDVSAATGLFLRSFLGAQKYSVKQALEKKFSKYLDSDVEPSQLLHHRLRTLVLTARAFERQLSGGIEPTIVSVDCAELQSSIQGLNITSEAISKYYQSAMFQSLYSLVIENGVPIRIEHSLIPK
jgi:DNA replication licensing factor MCM2